MNAWRAHVGQPALPTLALAGFVVLAAVAVHVGVAMGMSAWLGFFLMAGVQYLAFTPMHEAAHGNVGGSARRKRLDVVTGWTMGLIMSAPYSAFRALHLRHHSKTNVAEHDPDYWVAGPLWSLPLRLLTITPAYYWHFLRDRSSMVRREAVLTWSCVGVGVIAGAGLTLAGFGVHVFALWLLPATLALAVLAFFFDWMPHHPHSAVGRFIDTRVVLFPGLETLLLGQNLHAVHHAWPRVPWYRYGAVFRAERQAMEASGTRVLEPRLRGGLRAPLR